MNEPGDDVEELTAQVLSAEPSESERIARALALGSLIGLLLAALGRRR